MQKKVQDLDRVSEWVGEVNLGNVMVFNLVGRIEQLISISTIYGQRMKVFR